MGRAYAGLVAAMLVVAGCDVFDTPLEVPPQAPAEGTITLGVGTLTLELAPCIARLGLDPPVLQLVGPAGATAEGERVHVEIPAASDGSVPARDKELDAGLAVLRLGKPLAADEERVLQNHDLRVRLTEATADRITGLMSGRLEDLQIGRTHEVRAKFSCALDRGAD